MFLKTKIYQQKFWKLLETDHRSHAFRHTYMYSNTDLGVPMSIVVAVSSLNPCRKVNNSIFWPHPDRNLSVPWGMQCKSPPVTQIWETWPYRWKTLLLCKTYHNTCASRHCLPTEFWSAAVVQCMHTCVSALLSEASCLVMPVLVIHRSASISAVSYTVN